MIKELPRCPECGYTKEDAALWMDHHLCKGKIPGTTAPKKKMRSLKLPDGNTEYEKLRDGILEAPATWLPGLLIAAVAACVKNNVFQAGGLLSIVRRVALKEDPNALGKSCHKCGFTKDDDDRALQHRNCCFLEAAKDKA